VRARAYNNTYISGVYLRRYIPSLCMYVCIYIYIGPEQGESLVSLIDVPLTCVNKSLDANIHGLFVSLKDL